jgi:hypothetical protein
MLMSNTKCLFCCSFKLRAGGECDITFASKTEEFREILKYRMSRSSVARGQQQTACMICAGAIVQVKWTPWNTRYQLLPLLLLCYVSPVAQKTKIMNNGYVSVNARDSR